MRLRVHIGPRIIPVAFNVWSMSAHVWSFLVCMMDIDGKNCLPGELPSPTPGPPLLPAFLSSSAFPGSVEEGKKNRQSLRDGD